MKKYRLLLIHCAALLFLLALAVKYAEEIHDVKEAVYVRLRPVLVSEEEQIEDASQPAQTEGGEVQAAYTTQPTQTEGEEAQIVYTLQPVQTKGDEWFLAHPLIYHAGGEIHGSSYTNSPEAVEKTLAEHPGKCFIEMDFRYTKDGVLVCVHDWEDAFLDCEEAPTLEEFLSRKIQGKFTPLTAERLLRIMAENPDMYLVTDVKGGERENIAAVIAELVELCGRDASILDRMIIQLYTGREKSEIQAVYPFDDHQFLFTTYAFGGWSLEVAQICNEENISVITSPQEMIPDEDIAMLNELGFTIFEHTVNRADVAQARLNRGIAGFYTDVLEPEDLIP